MNIECTNEKNAVQLKSIEVGTFFEMNGRLYIKTSGMTSPVSENHTCIDIELGGTVYLHSSRLVTPATVTNIKYQV